MLEACRTLGRPTRQFAGAAGAAGAGFTLPGSGLTYVAVDVGVGEGRREGSSFSGLVSYGT